MRKCKIAAVLLLLGLIAFVCCGCGESFVYKAYTDADGGIHKEYQLLYDAKSSDAEVVKAQAVKAMLRYVDDMGLSEYATLHDTTAGEVTLSLYFPSATDYQIACGYTGREKNEAENSKLDGIYKVSETTLDSYLEEETLSKARDYVDEEYRDFNPPVILSVIENDSGQHYTPHDDKAIREKALGLADKKPRLSRKQKKKLLQQEKEKYRKTQENQVTTNEAKSEVLAKLQREKEKYRERQRRRRGAISKRSGNEM